jgi:glycosyltransferase involved in cell wall biosynthesis
MRIVYITAGAAGMFCGSCMHDNTLVSALIAQGHDALLVPTYTPIRTDELDVSTGQIFFGGINVYLEQKSALFRRTPWFLDRLLNARWLLNWVSRFAAKTRAEELGELTLSMLRGKHGNQRKEIDKLVWWLEHEHRPDILHLTNVLLSGMVPVLKERLKVPVLATLQGDDVFLEFLPKPYRAQVLALVKEHCRAFDGFIATSADYADFMAGYLDIPRHKIDVVYPGLNLRGHDGPRPNHTGQPFTIGYFARICPEKGLHVLVEAFRLFKQMPGTEAARLRVSGWLGEHHKPYFEGLQKKLKEWRLADHFEYVESPDLASKVRFFQGVDVLSVPTTWREPKGLYVLEAWANGLPVVQPRHGSFPELIEASGGGLLVRPEDPEDLARGLHQLLHDPPRREELGRRGQAAVRERFHAAAMTRDTLAIYHKHVG